MADLTVASDVDSFMAAANKAAMLAVLDITLGGAFTISGSFTTTLTVTGNTNVTLPTSGTLAILGANTFTALQTITQTTANTGILASTGYSLTGSNATSMIDLAGTWNTTGAPTAIKLNITNTASGNALFADFQLGGTSYFKVSKSGQINFGPSGSFINDLGAGHLYITCGGSGAFWSRGGQSSCQVPTTLYIGGILSLESSAFALKMITTSVLQLGNDHATTATAQTLVSHSVTTGTGANMIIGAGTGSVAGGAVILATRATTGALQNRLLCAADGSISFPAVTAVTTETVVSDTTWPVTINGTTYKICLKA